jgi:hypothetical protein
MALITVCFSGCDELGTKPDSVTVNVMTTIYVRLVDAENHEVNMNVDSVAVFIEMTKQGHDRLIFNRLTQGSQCQVTGSYAMSAGESITVTATIDDSYMGYTSVGPATAQLSWTTVNSSANFGAMYHWYPELTITMKKDSLV